MILETIKRILGWKKREERRSLLLSVEPLEKRVALLEGGVVEEFSIEREGDNYFVRDRGSSLGTMVNDAAIGLAENTLTQDLHGGENQILLGSDDSEFKFKVTLS
jgi:hypothetical protein